MRSRLCTLKINVSLVFSSQIVRWESRPGAIASSGRTGNRPVSRRTELKIIRLVIIFTVLAGVVVAQNRRCEIIRGLDVHRVVRAFVSLRPRLHGSAQLEFLEIQSENPKAWIRTCTAFSNCFATSFGKREGCTPSRWIGTLRSNRKLSGTWSRIPSSRLSNCRIHYLKMYMTLRKKDVGERRHWKSHLQEQHCCKLHVPLPKIRPPPDLHSNDDLQTPYDSSVFPCLTLQGIP